MTQTYGKYSKRNADLFVKWMKAYKLKSKDAFEIVNKLRAENGEPPFCYAMISAYKHARAKIPLYVMMHVWDELKKKGVSLEP